MGIIKRIVCTAIIILLFLMACSCESADKSSADYVIPDGALVCEAYVADVYGGADAIVTIISDDGFYDSGCNLNELLVERDLRGTVAGAIKYVKPNIEGWNDILDDGHLELVNHSYNHIRMEDGRLISYNYFALFHEIVDSDRWYEDTFGDEQIVFVCPENTMCRLGYSILEQNDFWAVRRGSRGYNSLSPEDGTEPGQWLNLMVQGICDDGVDTDTRNCWVDESVSQHLWLIEMWHNVMYDDDGFYQTINVSEAADHLDYIELVENSGVIWNATFTEAVKYIREAQNSEVTAYIIDDSLHVFVSLTNENMQYDTFDQPLTVCILLEGEYSNDELIVIDVVPGQEEIIYLQ